MLCCTVLANCGLHLEYAGESLLIDAPNGQRTAFDAVSSEEGERIISGLPPYQNLRGLVFTHKHSDHYDRSRVRAAAASHSDLVIFAPNGITPDHGTLQAGAFSIDYFSVPHSGEEFANVIHRVFLIRAGKHRIYVTGDAAWEHDAHSEIIRTAEPTAAFWNPNYVSHASARAFLRQIPQNYIYHLPVNAGDTFGFGRKCRSSFARFGSELPGTKLIEAYPTKLFLE